MIISVDTAAPLPAYEQIRTQVTALIGNGALPPGATLPPIRQLAKDLGIAPGTVAKAYALLDNAGLVITRGRSGTLVAERDPVPRHERLGQLRRAAEAYVRAARLLNVDEHAVRDALAAALQQENR